VLKKKYFQVFKKKHYKNTKGLKIGLCIKYFQVFKKIHYKNTKGLKIGLCIKYFQVFLKKPKKM